MALFHKSPEWRAWLTTHALAGRGAMALLHKLPRWRVPCLLELALLAS